MVLEVTAQDSQGNRFFTASRRYMPQAGDGRGREMVLGPDKKLGLIRDTSIQPFAPKEENLEINLPPGVEAAEVEVRLSYQPRPGNVYPIHQVRRRVSLIP